MKAITLACFAIAAVLATGCDQMAANQMADIHNQVANDAVKQYEITVRSGTAVDRCVHAGLVAAAYLQAQDEQNYSTWKSKQTTDCQAAGLST